MAARSRPLAGIRVLEFAQLFPGPYAALVLAELGAEVVKVEPPVGDPTRAVPPLVEHAGGSGALFCALNRGKKSVVLDLKDAGDVERYRKLARTARVVIDGYRAGVADRLGVGFDALSRGRADLVYATITGYGPTGPLAAEPGHDVTYSAWMGALHPAEPRLPEVVAADATGALWAALLALAHLHAPGNHRLDASLAGALHAPAFLDRALVAGGAHLDPVRHGSPGYNVYACSDGKLLALGALEPHFWQAACVVLGDRGPFELGHPAGAPSYEVVKRTAGHFAGAPRDTWVKRLREAGVPCAPVRTAREALDETLALTSWDPPAVRGPEDLAGAPELGEHTDEVLRDP